MPKTTSALASRRHILKAAGLAIGAAATSGLGIEQTRAAAYPERPIKIIVPFAAAGPTDIMARILAQNLGSALGGNFIVENKPGAGGNIGIGYAAHAAADGYTLLVVSTAYVVNPGLYAKIPYDPYKDFAPITELGSTPNSILVTPRLNINSIAELIARAKASPGELNWASPGAGGNIGIGYAAHAAADGYTLLVVSTAYVVNPGLYVKIPYDPYKDFAPITELGSTPNSILVTPKLKVSSIAELIARAKAKPGELNWASPGAGTTPHLSGEFLKIVGGIEMTHVPFNGAAPAIQALLAGTTQVAVSALPPVLPFAQSGEIKVLAVTSANRWPDLPDVPTMVELGYKDFIAETAQFFFAPGGTAPNIVEELSAKTMEVLKAPSIVEQLRVNGYEVTAAGSQALRKRLDVEIPKWRDIISKAGIKPV